MESSLFRCVPSSSYRDFLHPHLPVLCVESTTTNSVARRSNFLFNCICCVASRYCLEKPELARALQRFGRMECSRFPLDKCIEVVQAHLIYAHWNLMPGNRFETDSTWLRIGLAMRTALDLNLHRVALVKDVVLPPLLRATIIRTWLQAFVLDQILSSQLGKPYSPLGHASVEQYVSRLTSSPDDQRVVALVKYAQLLGETMDVLNFPASNDLSV